MKKQQFEISIDHAMMIGAKAAFDTCLRAAIAKAISTDSDEGSATLKISFEIFSSLDTEAQIAKRRIIYVRLGSEEDIHAKLRAFLITREKVLQMGYAKGTIDVTDPGRPTYMP